MIKLAVSGACGKMGKRIIALAQQDSDFKLVCALEHSAHLELGTSICAGINVAADNEEIKNCDVLIEFSSPQATISHLEQAIKFGKKVVIGTTGLLDEEKIKIEKAAEKIAVVFSPNMSIGVNLFFDIIKRLSSKISGNYDIKIREAHHVHKKDAPSGTAKRISEIIENSGKKVSDVKSIREDEIIGDHCVIFSSSVDTITLTHSAKTRDIFAAGALVAAKWVIDKRNGFYAMDDVLGL